MYTSTLPLGQSSVNQYSSNTTCYICVSIGIVILWMECHWWWHFTTHVLLDQFTCSNCFWIHTHWWSYIAILWTTLPHSTGSWYQCSNSTSPAAQCPWIWSLGVLYHLCQNVYHWQYCSIVGTTICVSLAVNIDCMNVFSPFFSDGEFLNECYQHHHSGLTHSWKDCKAICP